MAKRSLQASTAGIQQARRAYNNGGWTQEALAEQVNLKTRQPISKFLSGKSVDRHVFIEICTALELGWEEIAQRETTPDREDDLDVLAQEVREQIKPLIKERCGTMRVLDMTQPIALTGEQGIYTNVNILEKITGRKRVGIEELLQGCDPDEFERFGLSGVTEERVPGLEAVKRYSKLMVLGKPGAGKTTFLKYLAMQCIEGNFQARRIPVFITLKDFAEDENQPGLLTYLERLIAGINVRTNKHLSLQINSQSCQSIIQQGKLLILLDGLDEVREEDTDRVIRQIRDFSEQFYTNQFVITCRIAAKEYTFQQFTEVEVADFDNEQIRTFVGNWFKCREPKSPEKLTQKLIEKLEASNPIKELATNPLLLTLLCLEFEELLEFPTNRAELYERGLGILLSKWDTSRRIERDQVYKRLSLSRKEDLLSQIALTTFQEKNYFFKQKLVERYIADYISNLPDAKTDLETLLIESGAILKSIEGQHGLIVERAKGIYSFSHLTFHEYFTAREIETTTSYELLIARITERRWREVFLLTSGMMRSANSLILQMKSSIDNLVADYNLQDFLAWVDQKSCLIQSQYSLGSIRAFYFFLVEFFQRESDLKSTLLFPIPPLAQKLEPNFSFDYNFGMDMGLLNTKKTALKISNTVIQQSSLNELSIEGASFETRNFSKDDADIHQYRICQEVWDETSGELHPDFDGDLNILDELNAVLRYPLEENLREALLLLKYELPEQLISLGASEASFIHEDFDYLTWVGELEQIMIEYRQIGYDWQFSEEERQLLHQYYDANLLLVDCLNSDCYVSREVRQEIEDTLLLPIAEIEKYKAAKAAQQSD